MKGVFATRVSGSADLYQVLLCYFFMGMLVYPLLTIFFFSKTWQELCLSIKEGKKFKCTGTPGCPGSHTGLTHRKHTNPSPLWGLTCEKTKSGC